MIDNIAQNMLRGRKLVQTLDKIGAPVSKDIRAAIEFDKLTYNNTPQELEAREVLAKATTQKELNAAMQQWAAVETAHRVQEGVQKALEAEKYRRLSDALDADQVAIFGFLADAFEPLAKKFTAAALRLPAGIANRDFSPFKISRSESEALVASTEYAQGMNELWRPYREFAQILDYLSDDRYVPYTIGEIQSWGQANEISNTIRTVKVSDAGKTYGPIFPWVILVGAGVRIRLHRAPWDIQEAAFSQAGSLTVSVGAVGEILEGSW